MIDENVISNKEGHGIFVKELRRAIDKVFVHRVVKNSDEVFCTNKYIVAVATGYEDEGGAYVYFSDTPSGENQISIYSTDIKYLDLWHTDKCGRNFPLPTGIGSWHCTCGLDVWVQENYWSK